MNIRRTGLRKPKKMQFHPDSVRAQIQAIKLVQTLQDFIFATRNKNGLLIADLSPAKVTAALGLLRKCVPDLINAAITADLNVRYVAELPKVLTREEWLAKYGTNHLELKAMLVPPTTNGSGNGHA